MSTDEGGFGWVIVADWADSSVTVHGGFRTAQAARQFAADAWTGLEGCAGWRVVLMSDPPVPRQRPLADG